MLLFLFAFVLLLEADGWWPPRTGLVLGKPRGAVVFSREHGCLVRRALLDRGACLGRAQILAASRHMHRVFPDIRASNHSSQPITSAGWERVPPGHIALGRYTCCSSCWRPVRYLRRRGSRAWHATRGAQILFLSSKIICSESRQALPVSGRLVRCGAEAGHSGGSRRTQWEHLPAAQMEPPFGYEYRRVAMPFLGTLARLVLLGLLHAILLFFSVLLCMDEVVCYAKQTI